MKPVHLYLLVAASGAIGLLWLSISPSALPSEPVLGGVLALSLAGIALVSFGAVSTRHVDHLARARRIRPGRPCRSWCSRRRRRNRVRARRSFPSAGIAAPSKLLAIRRSCRR